MHLAAQRALLRKIAQPRELLRDRARALQIAAGQVVPQRARNAARIDAAVLVKTSVLDCDHRVCERLWDTIRRDLLAFINSARGERLAVRGLHDECAGGRPIRRTGGERQRGEAVQQIGGGQRGDQRQQKEARIPHARSPRKCRHAPVRPGDAKFGGCSAEALPHGGTSRRQRPVRARNQQAEQHRDRHSLQRLRRRRGARRFRAGFAGDLGLAAV